MVTVIIPGAPVAKGRPRVTMQGRRPRVFTPAKTRSYEDAIRCEAVKRMDGAEPLQGPLTVSITAYVAIPKAIKGQKRLDAAEGILKPTTRPDIDNYVKIALDGCNAIVFRDDNQVADLFVRKRYSERPRLVITVETDADDAAEIHERAAA